MRHRSVPLSLLAVLMTAAAAGAQEVRGTLLAAETGVELPLGTVQLLGVGMIAQATATTDVTGQFRLVAPAPGTYAVRATHLNAQALIAGTVELEAGQVLTVELALNLLPIELDPLMVSVRPEYRPLVRNGFYQRSRSELGSFVTPEQIEKWRPMAVTDVLRRMPGVRLLPDANFAGRYHIVMSRNTAGSLSGGSRCLPSIWVDDMYLPGFDIDMLPAQDVFAVEVYRSGLQMPQRYRGAGRGCGAVVIWTGTRPEGG